MSRKLYDDRYAGTLATTTSDQTITTTTTVQGATGGCTATTDETITTVQHPSLSVVKEVSADGSTWSSSGGNFAPGATIYYRITVINNGTSNASNVILTDAQPAYTTYQAGSARSAKGPAVNYNAATALTDASDGDGYDFNITTANTATYNIGSLAPGQANQVQLFFTVKVN